MSFFVLFSMDNPDMGVIGDFLVHFDGFCVYRGIGRRRFPGLRLVRHKAFGGNGGSVRASREALLGGRKPCRLCRSWRRSCGLVGLVGL